MISVVIPTHNRVDLLPRAIESVLKQTYSDFEIIIVSDGSTDNTEAVVKKYIEKDSRIKFIGYSPAKGGNIARNTGIKAAQGDYIAFLDDDDEWLPKKLEKQLSVFEKSSKIGLVYTGVHIIYVNEGIEYNSLSKEDGDLSKRILIDNCIGTTSTVMVKKNVLSKSGGFDIKLKALQDFDLWIRICQSVEIGFVDEPLINYYNYSGSKQISALTQKYIEAFEYINHKYSELFSKQDNKSQEKKWIEENFLLANKAMRNGEAKLSRLYLKNILNKTISKKALAYYLLSFTSYKFILKTRSIVK